MAGEDLDAYCGKNEERFVSELIEALRIPSISADPDHTADVARNAEYFAEAARAAGFTRAEVLQTEGQPAVYAERIVDEGLPTVLIYGHHDVQPVDPIEEWKSPPFEPEIRDGQLFARGAVDDKGQVFMHLKAVQAHLQTRGELPVNMKMLVEGEEEVGSAHFDDLVTREKLRLSCDVVVVSDTGFFARGVPSLVVSLRGMALAEVVFHGPSLDLHSGSFGGAIVNPAEAIARLVSQLKDPQTGRVLVDGFYDDVVEVGEARRADLAKLPVDDATFRAEAGGVSATFGETGYTDLERRTIRPTLEINGIYGGYAGPGSKTIIPASAGVKITCRLVPNQRPADIVAKLEKALAPLVPDGIRADIRVWEGGNPVVTDTDDFAVLAARRAIARVFGDEPLFTREGGSIPPVETFQRILGVPEVLIGFGLPDDQIHAPNEKFDLDQYQKGIRTIAHLWDELAVAYHDSKNQ